MSQHHSSGERGTLALDRTRFRQKRWDNLLVYHLLSLAFRFRVPLQITCLLVLQDTGCSRKILRLSSSARADIDAVNLGITAVLGQGLVVWRVGLSHNRLEVAEVVALLGVVSCLLKKQPHRQK